MKINEVIEAGKFSITEVYHNFVIPGDILGTATGFLGVALMNMLCFAPYILILIIIRDLKKDDDDNFNPRILGSVMFILSITLVILLQFMFIKLPPLVENGIEMEKWKEQSIYPFIEQLPVQKQELEAIKRIDSANNRYFSEVSNANFIPVSVIYADSEGNGRTFESEVLIKYDVTNGTPYMTFKEFNKSLGNGIEQGIVNPVIHLPKGYYFNQ